jgi:dipeptide/tripeptide permease
MNLITFLTLEMHMLTVKAANIITNFGGTCGLTPLVGAFIADCIFIVLGASRLLP